MTLKPTKISGRGLVARLHQVTVSHRAMHANTGAEIVALMTPEQPELGEQDANGERTLPESQ